ncbi:MAG: redoxin family protein [Actinomycetota bacterium]
MSDDTAAKRPKTTFESLVNPQDDEPKSSSVPVLAIVAGVVVLIAIVGAMAIFLSGDDDGDEVVTDAGGEVVDPIELSEITVDGDVLPRLEDPASDPAIGMPAPEISGLSYNGEPVEIFFDGRPKVISFLAHWCPVCQEELPQLVEWIDGGAAGDEVDVYVVATAITDERPNFPPSAWFQSEGLSGVPVLMDSDTSTAAEAFGLNAFPYWVVIDADGTVALRVSGLVTDLLDLPPTEAFDFLAQFAVAE